MSSENSVPDSDQPSPFVRPAAPGASQASADVTATPAASSPANTSPRRGAKNPSPRRVVGKVMRSRLRADLAQRDRAILAILAMHRFLSTHQVQRFCFPTSNQLRLDSAAREARRTLLRLKRAGLLQTVTARRVGGIEAGSGVQIWQVTSAGHRLATETAKPGTEPAWRYRADAPTTRFLGHELAIADAHLAAIRAAGEMRAALQVQIEQRASRTYTGVGGTALRLTPDLALRLAGTDAEGSYEDRWLLEVDAGSESIPTLVHKCEQYESYYRSGVEQADGGAFPLVLWIFHGTRATARLSELRRRVIRASRLTPQLFRYVTAYSVEQMLISGGGS